MSKEQSDDLGYVVFVRNYATKENVSYEFGTFEIMYCGMRGTFLGNQGFVSYKTKAGAEKGRISLEKKMAELCAANDGWRYQVGGVMKVTESMYREMEKQTELDFEVARKALDSDPVFSDEKWQKQMEKIRRRSLIKVVPDKKRRR